MRANEQSPPGADGSAPSPLPRERLRRLWMRLTGRPPLPPLGPEAAQQIADAWREAVGKIVRIETTATVSLHVPARRLDALCAALEDDVARLRKPLPRSAIKHAGPRDAVAAVARAQRQLGDAEEVLDAMAKESGTAGAWAAEWERLAMLAVEVGDDGLAREALDHRAELGRVHSMLEREIEVGRAVLAEMRAALEQVTPGGDGVAKP